MLGTFPPQPVRWSMEFYYPNRNNDMWRIAGLVFFGDRDHFWLAGENRFDRPRIEAFLSRRGIALWDVGMAVRRLNGNASDKFLEIVEEIDLAGLLSAHPTIRTVVTAGEKATGVVAGQASVSVPAVGVPVACAVGDRAFELWRMPSSSRAYPLALAKKAEAYRTMFAAAGLFHENCDQ